MLNWKNNLVFFRSYRLVRLCATLLDMTVQTLSPCTKWYLQIMAKISTLVMNQFGCRTQILYNIANQQEIISWKGAQACFRFIKLAKANQFSRTTRLDPEKSTRPKL